MVNIASTPVKIQDPSITELKTKLKGLNVEGVAELKVPVAEAKKATEKNGLDELYLNFKGNDYIAYGKGMNLGKLQESYTEWFGLLPVGGRIRFDDEYNGVPITDRSNESNSLSEGSIHDKKKVPVGGIITGATVLTGIVIGAKNIGVEGAVAGAILSYMGGMILGMGTDYVISGVKKALVNPDYDSIKKITK